MIIQHNISSLNAWRNTKINNGATAKNLEKLSSGFKVNRSADDAAGLAISEKMRGQIRGLAMAEMNVRHGISLIQTAEGGMDEIGNMLQRQRELIVQSLNGTYTDEDRELLQREIDQLTKAIGGISESTHFNNIPLLNVPPLELIPNTGAPVDTSNYITQLSTANGVVSSTGQLDLEASSPNGVNSSIMIWGSGGSSGNMIRIADASGNNAVTLWLGRRPTTGTPPALDGVMGRTASDYTASPPTWTTNYTYSGNGYNVAVNQIVTIATDALGNQFYNFEYEIINNSAQNITTDFIFQIDTMFTVTDNPDFSLDGRATAITTGTVYNGSNIPSTVDLWSLDNTNLNAQVVLSGTDITNPPDSLYIGRYNHLWDFGYNGNSDTIDDSGYAVVWRNRTVAAGGQLDLNTRYGVTDPRLNPELGIEDGGAWRSTALYIHNGANKDEYVRVDRYDCRTSTLGIDSIVTHPREAANQSLLNLDKAINTIGTYRANCGAQQNRLEHSLNNLGVTKENLQAAESTIRDVDMAKEMMGFTKNNILVQAAQSMLAQANQLPQGVLSLLR